MAVKFDTVKEEELAAQTHRIFGKIALTADKDTLNAVFAALLQRAKEGAAKAKDLLRIADKVDAEVPAKWRSTQEALLKADAELEAKQRESAADSREAGAKKRRLQKEQEERDAEERAEFERWKRSRGAGSKDSSAFRNELGAS